MSNADEIKSLDARTERVGKVMAQYQELYKALISRASDLASIEAGFLPPNQASLDKRQQRIIDAEAALLTLDKSNAVIGAATHLLAQLKSQERIKILKDLISMATELEDKILVK